MQIFFSTMSTILGLLVIGFVGFIIVYKKIVDQRIFSFLSILSLEISLPAMIFSDLVLKFDPVVQKNWFLFPLWWLLTTIFLLILSYIFKFLSPVEHRKEFFVSLLFQNGIFFPLAIFSTIGKFETYKVDLFLFTIFYAAFLFNTFSFFFTGNLKNIDRAKTFHPVFIATLLAIIMKLTSFSVYIPKFIISAFLMLGVMTIPLLILILGGNIYIDLKNTKEIYFKTVTIFVIVKNFIFPLLTLLILWILKIGENISIIILLQSAVPPITALPILVERNNGNKIISNQIIFFSFLVSPFSIAFFIFLFYRIFQF